MTANPFHLGHLALIEAALRDADALDVYVGHREKAWTLPHRVRMEALREGVEQVGLSDRVRIISSVEESVGSILKIGPKPYSTLAMGSDIANKLADPKSPFRDYERRHFLSFPHVTVLDRKGFELTAASRASIERIVGGISVHPAVTELQGTLIRQDWRNGHDIRRHLPEGVYETIKPHLEKFSAQA